MKELNQFGLLAAFLCAAPLLTASTVVNAKGTTTLCYWKFNIGKDGVVEGRSPCVSKVLRENPTVIEEYKTEDQKFVVEHLPEGQANKIELKEKVKLNGKIATMEEENRYSFDITTDDLKTSFGHTEVLPGTESNEPKFTSLTARGVWVQNLKTDCKPSSYDKPKTVIIKNDTLTRYGGESVCQISHTGYAANGTGQGIIFAKCQNEEVSNNEVISFTMSPNGKKAIMPEQGDLYRCP